MNQAQAQTQAQAQAQAQNQAQAEKGSNHGPSNLTSTSTLSSATPCDETQSLKALASPSYDVNEEDLKRAAEIALVVSTSQLNGEEANLIAAVQDQRQQKLLEEVKRKKKLMPQKPPPDAAWTANHLWSQGMMMGGIQNKSNILTNSLEKMKEAYKLNSNILETIDLVNKGSSSSNNKNNELLENNNNYCTSRINSDVTMETNASDNNKNQQQPNNDKITNANATTTPITTTKNNHHTESVTNITKPIQKKKTTTTRRKSKSPVRFAIAAPSFSSVYKSQVTDKKMRRKQSSSPPPPTLLSHVTRNAKKKHTHSNHVSLSNDIDASPFAQGQSHDQCPTSSTTMIVMEGLVWKRRNGLGKFSTQHAWERRKLVLQGTKLKYYFVAVDKVSDNNKKEQEEEVHSPKEVNNSHNTAYNDHKVEVEVEDETDKKNFWEQAAENWNQATENMRNLPSMFPELNLQHLQDLHHFNNNDPNDPRGVMDLIKDHATVSTSIGHSGAPTPFCITVKINKLETKWKFCFDSYECQNQWLKVLSDTLVQHSLKVHALEHHHHNHYNNSNNNCYQAGDVNFALPTMGTNTNTENTQTKQENTNESNNNTKNESRAKEETGTKVEIKGRGGGGLTSVDDRSEVDTKGGWIIEYLQTMGKNYGYAFVALFNTTMMILPQLGFVAYTLLIVSMNVVLWRFYRYCSTEKPSLSPVLVSGSDADTDIGTLATGQCISTEKDNENDSKNKGGEMGIIESTHKANDIDNDEETVFKPVPGSTYAKLEGITTATPGWCPISGSSLQVRSVGYSWHKKKVPSPGELYDCVAVDIFTSSQQIPNFVRRTDLTSLFSVDSPQQQQEQKSYRWHCPELFVVSVAYPTEEPKLMKPTTDGPSLNIVMYFQMKAETKQILESLYSGSSSSSNNQSTSSSPSSSLSPLLYNGVKLFDEWCRRSPNDADFQARFKIVPLMHNLEEIGLPSYISKYNSKPVLIKRNQVTGFFDTHTHTHSAVSHHESSKSVAVTVTEFRISLHPFPYLAKMGFHYVYKNCVDKLVASLGVVIEGRTDDELPEVVVGATKLCRIPTLVDAPTLFTKPTQPESTSNVVS